MWLVMMCRMKATFTQSHTHAHRAHERSPPHQSGDAVNFFHRIHFTLRRRIATVAGSQWKQGVNTGIYHGTMQPPACRTMRTSSPQCAWRYGRAQNTAPADGCGREGAAINHNQRERGAAMGRRALWSEPLFTSPLVDKRNPRVEMMNLGRLMGLRGALGLAVGTRRTTGV